MISKKKSSKLPYFHVIKVDQAQKFHFTIHRKKTENCD